MIKFLENFLQENKSQTRDIINFQKLFRLFGLYEGKEVKEDIIKQVDYEGEHYIHKTRFNKYKIGITDKSYIQRFIVPITYTESDVLNLKERLEFHTNKSIDIEIIKTGYRPYFDIEVYWDKE